MEEALALTEERQITNELGEDLENALKDSKKLDKEISSTLNYHYNPLRKIPLISKLVGFVMGVKPLASLEILLRTSLNNSIIELGKVGERANFERERINQLKVIYKTAEKEEWGTKEFLQFIDNNSDIDFTMSVDGNESDFKEFSEKAESIFGDKKKKEKRKEYLEWFNNHITLSKNYLDSMYELGIIGSEWVGGMARNYFDLTQLRTNMEQIRKTLDHLGKGVASSFSVQQALQEYGKSYISGMEKLFEGYKKIKLLREKQAKKDEFKKSIHDLKLKIGNTRMSPEDKYALPLYVSGEEKSIKNDNSQR